MLAAAGNPTLNGSGAGGPDRSAHREPQPRTQIDWTVSRQRQALRRADAGDMRELASLCDAIMGDDRAPSVLRTRGNALFGAPLTFEASGDGRRKGRVVRAADLEDDFWSMCPEVALGQLKLWGDLLGVGLAELVWVESLDHGGRVLAQLRVWHPGGLRWDWPTRQWFLRVEADANGGTREIPITPGDGKWVMYCPYGTSTPWRHGLWRGMGALWLVKDFAQRDFGLHQEVHGLPIRVGMWDGGKLTPTPKDRAELAGYLGAVGRDTGIVAGAGLKVELVEAKARTWEMYTAQITLSNTGMSVMAIGTNLPTEVAAGIGTGAYAQNLVRLDYKRADAEAMSTCVHDQILTWWAEYNFGSMALAPWPVWDVEPPADRTAMAAVWKTVAEAYATFKAQGVAPPIKVIEERFDIPLEMLKPPDVPPPGAPANDDAQPAEQEAA
jgi:phage gp29-like protein